MSLSKKTQQLEKWVEKMESSSCSLAETIALYSKSILLIQEISDIFDTTKKDIEILHEEGSMALSKIQDSLL